MRGAVECGWAIAALILPSAITIARLYTTFNSEGAGARTDDNVLFAKLNDFYLGGCTFPWSFKVLSCFNTQATRKTSPPL